MFTTDSTYTLDEKLGTDLINNYDRDIPHVIKYMGAKRKILDYIIEAINDNYSGGVICDLFAGTSILSGALGKLAPMHSNDIQEYSSVLANTYLSNINWKDYPSDLLNEIVNKATEYVKTIKSEYPDLDFSNSDCSIDEFIKIEKEQQKLIDFDFENLSHHLFIKYYSGTYWSFEQCAWIDAFRKVADEYQKTPIYYVILSSLMFAMSYNSQSTGHFAQYRDATSISSKDDILLYRQKEIVPYFKNKFNQLRDFIGVNEFSHNVTSQDYSECLETIPQNSTVYADPPYAFVHYSRFYHALETLVKYDYPKVAYKGRYRVDRHQSPFCKRSEVRDAFYTLFAKIKEKKATLILSYSNTGMISFESLIVLASEILGSIYKISTKEVSYRHSTMGRKNDKDREVKEVLLIAKYIQQ